MNEIRIEAPAKINIGLEIPGRRDDGYHEIRTILAMLDLADTLTLSVSDEPAGEDLAALPYSENLVTRALHAFSQAVPLAPRFRWSLTKRVPAAAGLGGASSDAAAALIAANTLSGSPLGLDDLATIAGTLGSDITFFLGGACALASGRGTDLTLLPALETGVLLIVPRQSLPAKTATMYRALRPKDFSPGHQVAAIADSLRAGNRPRDGEVVNAFARALSELIPNVADLRGALSASSPYPYGLSGAGPAHYVLAPASDHGAIQQELSTRFGDWLSFFSTSIRMQPPSPTQKPAS